MRFPALLLSALLPTLLIAAAEPVSNRTLDGLAVCGYQGWFNTPGDGSGRGWRHYRAADGGFGPGRAGFDVWPDLSEAEPDELTPTPFSGADGAPRPLTSSRHPKTVDRHFRWMREYDIAGVFLQRFLQELATPDGRENCDAVLASVDRAARTHGRVWALMYDTSGAEEFERFAEDLRNFVAAGYPGGDRYLHHRGKPLIGIWGLFAERPGSIDFFAQALPLAHELGFRVVVGCDSAWRTRPGAEADRVRELLRQADVISPWMVGRFGENEVDRYYAETVAGDRRWCRKNGIDFLPVAFPGFSWGNLKGWGFDLIPRQNGRFFQRQLELATAGGDRMLYVAMFDELDEGTAVMKLDDNPPPGFLPVPGPSDRYLKLTGQWQP